MPPLDTDMDADRKPTLVNFKQLEPLAAHSDIYKDAERVAIIDMGSNSFRLIVVEYVSHLSFKLVDEVRESVRISEGMAELDVLRPAAMDRAARAAQIYASFCRAGGITDIVAVGTSAIRDARNQARFLARIERESGIPVRVLSGPEEAHYGYLAAVNSTTLDFGFVVDLGGGSLQITRVEDRRAVEAISFPLGAVRLTEGFLHSDPAAAKEMRALADHLEEKFYALKWFKYEPGMRMVGEGGTLRLVARLAQVRDKYPLDLLHGYLVQYRQVEEVRDMLAPLTVAARKRIGGMKSDRADISLGGAIAVETLMRVAGFDEMEICSQGLREGIFYERFFAGVGRGRVDELPLIENVRLASVLNLAHLYRFQEQHAEHVAHLTLSMFDQLPRDCNLCSPQDRDVLWAASMLHDIGVTVDYHDHHKHGSYLILNAGLPGYTHRETAMIALLTRYHRKGKPTLDELAPLFGDGDEQRLLQMCALLRLAEQIDRPRDSAVRDVNIVVQGDRARMELVCRGDEQVSLWAVEHHRDIFEDAFGYTLEIVPVPDDDLATGIDPDA